MPTTLIQNEVGIGSFQTWRAADYPVEPVNDHTFPIPPFKHPPTREDFKNLPRKKHPHDTDSPHKQDDEGHVDEFA